MENVTIPRQLKISSRIEDNSVEMVRKRLRTNLFDHKHYDPSLTGQSAKRHYQGIYQMNNPKHVDKNPQSKNEPKNFYANWAQNYTPDQLSTLKQPIK